MDDLFIRVGTDYFKQISYQDKNGNTCEKLAYWKRQTILDDFGREFLKAIRQYDCFVNVPSNTAPPDIDPSNFNLYHQFQHVGLKGDWPITESMLQHIFGEQYELGLDYIQLLYQQPSQILPILCLVSRQNQTGKTTYITWLYNLFFGNVAVVGNQDLHSEFNSHYINKLIIAVDESKIDKNSTLEKLKSLSTCRTVYMNGKFQAPVPIDFFAKIILLSNYEDSFITARDEDVRFWIRRLTQPPDTRNIDQELRDEIPAFVHFLNLRRMSTQMESRMWFAPEQLRTSALEAVVENSKSWLYKELNELILNFFDNNGLCDSFLADPTDLKKEFFALNHSVTLNYLRRVLRDEFKMSPGELARYTPFESITGPGCSKVGRPYSFARSDFVPERMTIDTILKNVCK